MGFVVIITTTTTITIIIIMDVMVSLRAHAVDGAVLTRS